MGLVPGRQETVSGTFFLSLGFTHISGKNRRGYYTVKRWTIAKRLRAKLLPCNSHVMRPSLDNCF
jgi:hypothetical protein